MIKYLGSKKKLLPQVEAAFRSCVDPNDCSEPPVVADLFSGAGNVAVRAKACGYRVYANDMQMYATTIASAYLRSSRGAAWDCDFLIELMQEAAEKGDCSGEEPYFVKAFCGPGDRLPAKFFQNKNGWKAHYMREVLRYSGTPMTDGQKALGLTMLMEALDRVDNTTGVQMAYLKKWCRRAQNDLALRSLRIPDGPVGEAFNGRAEDFFEKWGSKLRPVDIAYLDPPYNQHNYRGNYHIWETLVRWDNPERYGKANKRVDVKDAHRKSDFNSKRKAIVAMEKLVASIRARFIVASFSNEGFIPRQEMIRILSTRGEVSVQGHGHGRYIGHAIGGHNDKGERVSKATHSRNVEHLYICKVRE